VHLVGSIIRNLPYFAMLKDTINQAVCSEDVTSKINATETMYIFMPHQKTMS